MTFKPGQSGNPKGRPAGYQGFVDRARHWLESTTAEDIVELVADKKRLYKQSTFDAMILTRIAEAFSDNGRQSMNDLLDRVLGKPTQTIEQKLDATIEHKAVSATSEWLAETIGAGQAGASTKPVLN